MPTIILQINSPEGTDNLPHDPRNLSRTGQFGLILTAKNFLLVIGNSSSGIRESSIIGTTCLNLGSRQSDRDRGKNVINIKLVKNKNQIIKKIKQSLKNTKKIKSDIYGNGKASQKIAKIFKLCG